MRGAGARADVDRAARSWIGTPYHHHGEVKGAGADCAKLLKCVYVEAGIIADFDIPYYSPQFWQHRSEEIFLGVVSRYAHEIPLDQVSVGDLVLYKIGHCYAHGAIVVAPGLPKIVHAHVASRSVVEGSFDSVKLGTPIKGMKFYSPW